MKINKIAIALLAGLAFTATSCQENEYGEVDLTPREGSKNIDGIYTFNHPCAMYDKSDFDRVKASLNDGSAPTEVMTEFENLKNSSRVNKNYVPKPTESANRGGDNENYRNAMEDAGSAWQMALLWKLTDDNEYADAAIRIINEWVKVCKQVSGDTNQSLLAGAQGFTFANAGELLRDYEGWSAEDFNSFKTWMLDVWAERNMDFLRRHHDQCDIHYWSNWDLENLSSYLAIGILCEKHDMVNYVVNYFQRGAGNGAVKQLVNAFHADPLGSGEVIGQNQESGRDQGHAMMSCAVASNLAQMAYTLYKLNPEIPDLDFFAANDNVLMKMAEYVALTNLRSGSDRRNESGMWMVSADKIPFTTYYYCIDCACNEGKPHDHGWIQTEFADDGGRGGIRPGFEIYLNHYQRVKGLSDGYMYTKMMADKMRPEGGVGEAENRYGNNSGAYDQLGWGTLMLYR